MKKYVFVLFILLSSIVNAEDVRSWTTGSYSNNQTLVKELHIDNATKLKVKITGRTEASFDFVYILDQNNNLVEKLSGTINKEVVVDGSLVTAKLISDDSETDTGVTVTIEQATSNPNSNSGQSWTVSNYNNMENLQKRLSVSGANKLKVTIEGTTEANFDILTITDSQGSEVKRLSGSLNESFIVDGSFIDASFTSDDSATESGFTVHVENFSGSLPDVTTWTTGAYGNNDNLTKELRIAGATRLKVTIEGKTEETFDMLTITDAQGNQVKRISGSFNEGFIVDGSSITASFISDDSATESGFTVKIEKYSETLPNMVTWSSGTYANNMNLEKELKIPGATNMVVKITGKTQPSHDIFYIATNGTPRYRSSGSVNISLPVEGSSVTVGLISDGSITDRGITVTLEEKNVILNQRNPEWWRFHKLSFFKDGTKAVVRRYDGTYIYDITDLSHTTTISVFEGANYGTVISSDEKKLFAASATRGLEILDISNLSNPKKLGSFKSASYVTSVILSKDETKAYITNNLRKGFEIIDVTDPRNPKKLSEINSNIGEVLNVVLSKDETKAYVLSKTSFQVIDITNPVNPIILDTIELLTSEEIMGDNIVLSKNGTRAYIGKSRSYSYGREDVENNVLLVIDITNPNNLINRHEGDSIKGGDIDTITLSPDGTKLYTFGHRSGLRIIDVTNPTNPTMVVETGLFISTQPIYDGDIPASWGVFSPDGTKLFTRCMGGMLVVIDPYFYK